MKNGVNKVSGSVGRRERSPRGANRGGCGLKNIPRYFTARSTSTGGANLRGVITKKAPTEDERGSTLSKKQIPT